MTERPAMDMRWNYVVSVTTFIWIAMFVVGFVAFDADLIGMTPLIPLPESMEHWWDVANWVIWVIFVVDVCDKYKKSEDAKSFLRNNWLDLLFLIPFFRVLLILRVVRLLRLVRMMRMAGAISEVLEIHFFTAQKIFGFGRIKMVCLGCAKKFGVLKKNKKSIK